jgi:hypothetical protein
MWPAVVCLVAVLAFVRFRPSAPPVRLKRLRQLEAKVKRLERQRTELLGELETRAKAHADELVVIKGQVADRLNAFAEDMNMLKVEFSGIKNRAGLKAVVEGRQQA